MDPNQNSLRTVHLHPQGNLRSNQCQRQPSRISAIKVPPARTPSASTEVGSRSFRSSAVKGESTGKTTPTPTKSGALYPPVKTSTINLDAKPIYGPNGKPITEIDMDTGKPLMA